MSVYVSSHSLIHPFIIDPFLGKRREHPPCVTGYKGSMEKKRLFVNHVFGIGRMAQWVKVPGAKTDDPGTHRAA